MTAEVKMFPAPGQTEVLDRAPFSPAVTGLTLQTPHSFGMLLQKLTSGHIAAEHS